MSDDRQSEECQADSRAQAAAQAAQHAAAAAQHAAMSATHAAQAAHFASIAAGSSPGTGMGMGAAPQFGAGYPTPNPMTIPGMW